MEQTQDYVSYLLSSLWTCSRAVAAGRGLRMLFFEDLVVTHCVLGAFNDVQEVQWGTLCSFPALSWLAASQDEKVTFKAQ